MTLKYRVQDAFVWKTGIVDVGDVIEFAKPTPLRDELLTNGRIVEYVEQVKVDVDPEDGFDDEPLRVQEPQVKAQQLQQLKRR